MRCALDKKYLYHTNNFAQWMLLITINIMLVSVHFTYTFLLHTYIMKDLIHKFRVQIVLNCKHEQLCLSILS